MLDEALARGVISDAQRAQLAALSNENRHDSEERLKPVGTFNEIFVTFGVILLLNALSGLFTVAFHSPTATSIATIAMAWGVALYFDQRKRFRLPIIYACISAAIAAGITVNLGFDGHIERLAKAPLEVTLPTLIAALAMLAAGAWRFRVPFLMLPIAILFTVIITYAARHSDNTISLRLLLGSCGLAILAMAVRFDLQDPLRIKRWSDFAFWSYVVGSPLFVHSLFLTILLQEKKYMLLSAPEWIGMALLAMVVSFAGLLLNRRALILSTLIYVGCVIFRLLSTIGGPATMLFLTLLLIGLYVISLGSRWVQVRTWVMKRLPASWAWLKRLPPY